MEKLSKNETIHENRHFKVRRFQAYAADTNKSFFKHDVDATVSPMVRNWWLFIKTFHFKASRTTKLGKVFSVKHYCRIFICPTVELIADCLYL